MIVTICGAYRNAGDHLIGARARALLREFVDPDIITVDRKSVGEQHYALFNKARAVLLCGGPAYQREMYPKVYALDRSRISPPIVPFGLGWKSPAAKAPETFEFQASAADFIREIHTRIPLSSARDPLTVEVLHHVGVDNVAMTGCPVWYDLSTLDQPYAFKDTVRVLVLSMPAIMQPGVPGLMEWLTARFPNAEKIASFHHGVVPDKTPIGRERGRAFLQFARMAKAQGWKIAGLASDLPGMMTLYNAADLHVGYRVHAHLFCMSRRISSILINEDARGVGQAQALGAPNLTIEGGKLVSIQAAIDAHFDNRGATMARSVAIMRDTFPVMRKFLDTLRT